jgi:organic hydroperoxide reductase OsmC/OhrA
VKRCPAGTKNGITPKLDGHKRKMKPLPHVYEVALSGVPKGYATLVVGGVPALRSAPPKDFGGPGDAWSPEHLLLASVETCFMFTFQAVAQASKFEFLSLELSGNGTVDREDGYTRFTDIVLKSSQFQRAQIWNVLDECLRREKRLPCDGFAFGSRSSRERNRGRVCIGSKAGSRLTRRNVRYVPKADISARRRATGRSRPSPHSHRGFDRRSKAAGASRHCVGAKTRPLVPSSA